jgi:hypothetical protein
LEDNENEDAELTEEDIARSARKKQKLAELRAKKKAKAAAHAIKTWKGLQFQSIDEQLTSFWALYVEAIGSKLSTIEMSDKLDESNFMKPKEESEWELKYLLKLIERIAPEVKQNVVKDKKTKGDNKNTEKNDKDAKNKKNKKEDPKESNNEGPVVMILTPATNRAIEIINCLNSLDSKEHPIARLYSKFKKPPEQQKFLKDNAVDIAVGTPNRVEKLADLEDGLNLSRCKYLIIDMFATVKSFTILDMKETKVDFFNMYNKHFHKLVKSGQTKIILF